MQIGDLPDQKRQGERKREPDRGGEADFLKIQTLPIITSQRSAIKAPAQASKIGRYDLDGLGKRDKDIEKICIKFQAFTPGSENSLGSHLLSLLVDRKESSATHLSVVIFQSNNWLNWLKEAIKMTGNSAWRKRQANFVS